MLKIQFVIIILIFSLLKNPVLPQESTFYPMATVEFEKADIRDVIEYLARVGGVKIFLPDQLQSELSGRFKNILWKDAIEKIVEKNGYVLIQEGKDIFRVCLPEKVKPKPEISKELDRPENVSKIVVSDAISVDIKIIKTSQHNVLNKINIEWKEGKLQTEKKNNEKNKYKIGVADTEQEKYILKQWKANRQNYIKQKITLIPLYRFRESFFCDSNFELIHSSTENDSGIIPIELDYYKMGIGVYLDSIHRMREVSYSDKIPLLISISFSFPGYIIQNNSQSREINYAEEEIVSYLVSLKSGDTAIIKGYKSDLHSEEALFLSITLHLVKNVMERDFEAPLSEKQTKKTSKQKNKIIKIK